VFARIAFACLILAATPSAAAPLRSTIVPPSTAIPSDGTAAPTKAGVIFCTHLPKECATDRREPEMLTLTSRTWKLVNRIALDVNRTIRPVTDMHHFGINDVWTYPDDGMGDCEDIQLEKRRRFVAAGLPKRPFRLAVVIDETNSGHMVLMMRTDRGDYVFDNKTNAVLPWADTGYIFVKREGDDPTTYVRLAPPTNPGH
jgi:predicted transglutaminase-like cysteine proteinase